MDINARLATELAARREQITAAVKLLDEGASVPFIARYRKELTGALDDTQLRSLEERLGYLRELEERRDTVLNSVREQGKLSAALEAAIRAADTKTALEDLYLPYKPKRRTKAQIAREAGLQDLADALLADPELDPLASAGEHLNAEAGFADAEAALAGAQQILMEQFAEDAELAGRLRETIWNEGLLQATLIGGKAADGQKFRDYFDFSEKLSKIPSHRALALLRGRNEGILDLALLPAADAEQGHAACLAAIATRFGVAERGRPADAWLRQTLRLAWKAKLFTRIDLDLKLRLREAAEEEAIAVFARNLQDLLLAAPAGAKVTLGLDPGLRTGVKVAVIDRTGKLVDTTTIYPHVPKQQWDASLHTLERLVRQHGVELIAIGNGTGSRETEKLTQELIQRVGAQQLSGVMVSEAGASVYSASALAANEFPDLDVSLRGAVSIARRLQDPLAELVKIEPKAIGVGQYQHDVNQSRLGRSLEAVVEDCVNAVGVDLNTASVPLLTRVSGLSRTLAENIVAYRDENGAYEQRQALAKVPRLGAKTFEQAAGFLRIVNGSNPLDASAVHPEAYPVVEKISADCGRPVTRLIGDAETLRGLDPRRYIDERFGLPTVTDILRELEKPGRDPRPEFRTARFKDGVEDLQDLREGMILEGVVTNVTNFGAFVDVGVHQDGLVHISQLSHQFVKDPHQVVKAGAIVRARVLEVDVQRKRIALSLKLEAPQDAGMTAQRKPPAQAADARPSAQRPPRKPRPQQSPAAQGALANALSKALKR